MWISNSLSQSLFFLLLAFTTTTNGQGGSFGYTDAALKDTFCAPLSPKRTNYYGCTNLGPSNQSTAMVIRQYETTITYGTGNNFVPFILKSSGTGAQSFKGYLVRPASQWDSSECPLNCTIACRSHGMKYAIMNQGVCGCSPYFYAPAAPLFYTNRPGNPADTNYPDVNTPCGGTFGSGMDPGRPNCFGDPGNSVCGGLTGTKVSNTWNYRYGSGLIAASVWFDNSFERDTSLAATPDETHPYKYLGCFKIFTKGATLFQPSGFENIFNDPAECYTFCRNLNMPYVGMGIDDSTGVLNCKCGTSFSTATFLDDSTTACHTACLAVPGNPVCTTGSTADCCGHGLFYFTVYRHPRLLGCYEPPIPGSSIAGNYPVQCGPTPPIATLRPTFVVVGVSTSANPLSVIPKPTPGLVFNGGDYNYLGCYAANTLPSLIGNVYNMPSNSGLQACMNYCKTANNGTATIWAAVWSEFNSPFLTNRCYCSNTAPAAVSAGTRLAYSNCIAPCNGIVTDVCGGYEGQQAIYGPASYLAPAGPVTRSYVVQSTYMCIPASTSASSVVTSSTMTSSSKISKF
ncbi:hypothetical protein WAI453_011945 [Rhynchosporium graminicola]